MAITPLWGTDASAPSGTTVNAMKGNAFTIDFAQGITSYFGFGDYWMTNHGTIASWSGSIGGFTTSGVTSNKLAVDFVTGTSGAARAGESWTFTWKTGCTILGTIIFTGVSASVQFLGTDTTAQQFVGTGAPTETWAAS
jgi:hypothetical protein